MAADTRYKPPTKVVSRTIPYLTEVMRADPDLPRETRREPFYEFSRRDFYGNNYLSGAYDDT